MAEWIRRWHYKNSPKLMFFYVKPHEREKSSSKPCSHLLSALASASPPWLTDRRTLLTSSLAKGMDHTMHVPHMPARVHSQSKVWFTSFRCYSFVGRRGDGQVLSLKRPGCVYHNVIQHELLHALGFNHEQTRSDRDQHVRILLENVEPGGSSSRLSLCQL